MIENLYHIKSYEDKLIIYIHMQAIDQYVHKKPELLKYTNFSKKKREMCRYVTGIVCEAKA